MWVKRCVLAILIMATSTDVSIRFARAESILSPPASESQANPSTKNADTQESKANASTPRSVHDGGALPQGYGMRADYRALIETEARREGLAPEIAEAVMAVESGYNPAAIGGVGEIGLMQILPSTARMLGFAGSNAELAAPANNIRYGVRYLAQAWRLAGGDLCTATMKYRAGHGESRFSYRSVNYCLAVRSKLVARGFRVTGTVPVATFGQPDTSGGGDCRRKCLSGGRIGTVNLAALNTRLSALVVQVRTGR